MPKKLYTQDPQMATPEELKPAVLIMQCQRWGGGQYRLAEHQETKGIRFSDRTNPLNRKLSEEGTTEFLRFGFALAENPPTFFVQQGDTDCRI